MPLIPLSFSVFSIQANARVASEHGGDTTRTAPFGDDFPHNGLVLMIDSEDRFPYDASEASDASMLRMRESETGRQDPGPVVPSPFRVWRRLVRVFDSKLIQPLKIWVQLERDIAQLHRSDDRELHDIGINRLDIPAIRAGTYKRASSDDAERTVCCPAAGKPVTQTLTDRDTDSTLRWNQRPPQIFI